MNKFENDSADIIINICNKYYGDLLRNLFTINVRFRFGISSNRTLNISESRLLFSFKQTPSFIPNSLFKENNQSINLN
jgi:hypothetical protein